jgi:autotransporter translocation and assembly factor TamB
LRALTNPRFDLRLDADRVFAARRRDVEATITGTLQLGGQYRRPELSGNVRVEEGAMYLDEIYRQYLIVPLDSISEVDTSLVAMTPVLGNLIAKARNPFLDSLLVRNLDLHVGSNSWLRSPEMDVEVTGDLTVALDRADKDLRLTGLLNVARGTYTLYYPPFQSRRFNVRQGTIEFPGIPGIDPNLSISAAFRARNTQREPLDILAVVSGSLQNPRVRLTSDAQPPISESDLASYLFFGVPSWQVANNGAGSGDASAVRNFGLQAITPSVLGYASSGLQTLAQSVGVDYAALTSAEISPERRATSSAIAGFIANTQLEVGTYVLGSSSIFLAASKWLGSANLDPALRVQWRFRPEYSFELFTDYRLPGTPGFGIRPEAEPRKVYGFFLFREWGF